MYGNVDLHVVHSPCETTVVRHRDRGRDVEIPVDVKVRLLQLLERVLRAMKSCFLIPGDRAGPSRGERDRGERGVAGQCRRYDTVSGDIEARISHTSEFSSHTLRPSSVSPMRVVPW